MKRSKYYNNADGDQTKKKLKVNKNEYLLEANVNRLGMDFFTRYSSIDLAKNLLGKILCRKIDETILKGIIVETEAYLGPEDHASYTFGGRRTESNEPMYMKAGTCFIRFTYGMYYCFNLSSQDFGGAVLIRAAQPFDGIQKMIELRQKHPKAPKLNFAKQPNKIANGPSKLCIAFGIDKSINKFDITNDTSIWLETNNELVIDKNDIVESTRIGISASNQWSNKPLRYYLKDNKSVSKF